MAVCKLNVGDCDELVSHVTTLAEHVKNGNGKKANEVMEKVRKGGNRFKNAVAEVTTSLDGMYGQKKTDLESMQRKKGAIEMKIKPITDEVEKCQSLVNSYQSDVNRYSAERDDAERRRRNAESDYEAAENEKDNAGWYSLIPIAGPFITIGVAVNADGKMSEAGDRERNAIRDYSYSQSCLSDARATRDQTEAKLNQVKALAEDCKGLVDELHKECTHLKEATAFSLELQRVLKEILTTADLACGTSGHLQKILSFFRKRPTIVTSPGTMAKVNTLERQWNDVKDRVMDVQSGKQALLWPGQQSGRKSIEDGRKYQEKQDKIEQGMKNLGLN